MPKRSDHRDTAKAEYIARKSRGEKVNLRDLAEELGIFYCGAKHIIKGAGNGGSRCSWWEASARRQSTTHFCVAYGHGNAYLDVATHPHIYAPLCFRIG